MGRGKETGRHQLLQMAAGLRGGTSVPRGLSYPLLSSVTLSLRARPTPDVVTDKQVALSTGFGDLRAVSAFRGEQDSLSDTLSPDPAEVPAQDMSQNHSLLSYKSG